MSTFPVSGAGLGYRRPMASEIADVSLDQVNFMEVVPENWIGLGGYWGDVFRKVTDMYPLILHGLSLSIGSPEEVDWSFLKKVKGFIKDFNVEIYSDHFAPYGSEKIKILEIAFSKQFLVLLLMLLMMNPLGKVSEMERSLIRP